MDKDADNVLSGEISGCRFVKSFFIVLRIKYK